MSLKQGNFIIRLSSKKDAKGNQPGGCQNRVMKTAKLAANELEVSGEGER